MKSGQLSSTDWFGKLSAGLILGFILAVGITGVIQRYGFGDIALFSIRGQFLMWLVSPLWLATVSFCFLFRSGLSAWRTFGVANSVVWLLLFISTYLIS